LSLAVCETGSRRCYAKSSVCHLTLPTRVSSLLLAVPCEHRKQQEYDTGCVVNKNWISYGVNHSSKGNAKHITEGITNTRRPQLLGVFPQGDVSGILPWSYQAAFDKQEKQLFWFSQ